MGKRQLITDPSLAPHIQTLADKILQYVDDSVRIEHANGHSWHHPGHPDFFDGHRQYIGKLEAFLLAQGLPQFVPLPKWDPATTIPGPFRAVKVLPAVTAAGFGNVIANPSPNRPMPANLYNLTQFPSASALAGDPQLREWHAIVHGAVGGVMRDITVSPCAAVFWPWHAFIDDIYEDWLRRPQLVVANFGYNAGGWRVDQHPRFLADVTGDGRADIVGFGNAGVSVALNNGDGTFQAPQLVVANFGYNAGGWRVDQHPRFLADVTGDGRADIVGFGNAGVSVALNNGDGTFQAPQLVVANFGYNAGGWRVDQHPRFLADVTGDGRADIVGFGNAGVSVALNNGDGTFQAPQLVVANFGYNAGGWRVDQHPRFLADVTGDGRADIVGFGNAGVSVALNNGDGTFQAPQLVVANFGYNAGGWRVDQHPRFLADVTGDGRADIVGFGNAGVSVALNNGDGTFQAPQLVVANFGYNAGGWRVDQHPRFLADVTGDSRADIVGFGNAGVWVWRA